MALDWSEVSAWAAMITAVGAIAAVWLQNRSEAITRSLDMLLRLDEKFDNDRMKDLRRKTALGLLEGKMVDEAFYVFDFFEEIGLLLRMKAIHEKILFENFFHSLWRTGSLPRSTSRRCRKRTENSTTISNISL